MEWRGDEEEDDELIPCFSQKLQPRPVQLDSLASEITVAAGGQGDAPIMVGKSFDFTMDFMPSPFLKDAEDGTDTKGIICDQELMKNIMSPWEESAIASLHDVSLLQFSSFVSNITLHSLLIQREMSRFEGQLRRVYDEGRQRALGYQDTNNGRHISVLLKSLAGSATELAAAADRLEAAASGSPPRATPLSLSSRLSAPPPWLTLSVAVLSTSLLFSFYHRQRLFV